MLTTMTDKETSGIKTFLSLVKNEGYKKQKNVRRWKAYFAINFYLAMKEYRRKEAVIAQATEVMNRSIVMRHSPNRIKF